MVGDMPKVVQSMPPRRVPTGRVSRYDWPAVFDGRIHHFPEDGLPSTPRNFARQVRRAAADLHLRVDIRFRAGDGVYVQKLGPR